MMQPLAHWEHHAEIPKTPVMQPLARWERSPWYLFSSYHKRRQDQIQVSERPAA